MQHRNQLVRPKFNLNFNFHASFVFVINANRFYWLAQFLGWTAYCGLVTLSVYTNNPEKLTKTFFFNVLVLIITGVLATHVQRLFIIRLGWLNLKLPTLLPRLIFISLLTAVVIASIDFYTDYVTNLDHMQEKRFELSSLIVNVFAVLILVFAWNAIYFTFHYIQKSRKQEISNLELTASKRESELKNLRSQLNPHFLFNSLNSIKALIDLDPVKAREAVSTLSNLLRQSLLLGKQNSITLEEELKLVKNYLDLEKIRFEDRLTVEWKLDPELNRFEIPPFSIQMMIENAVKHGVSQLKKGGTIRIAAYSNEEHVVVEVSNTGELKTSHDLGVGIENIRQRLLLQYGNNAQFSLEQHDTDVIAKMEIKK